MRRWFFVTALFLSLLGCGAERELSQAPPPPPAEDSPSAKPQLDLSRLSTGEILLAKYDKVLVRCDLWVQRGAELVKTNAPSDSLKWDLLNDFSTERSFTLRGDAPNHSMAMQINFRSIRILGQSTYRFEDGTTYRASASPVVEMDFSYQTTTVPRVGLSVAVDGDGRRSIYERVKDMALNLATSGAAGSGAYFHFLECSIETELKPEFADHFRIEPGSGGVVETK